MKSRMEPVLSRTRATSILPEPIWMPALTLTSRDLTPIAARNVVSTVALAAASMPFSVLWTAIVTA